MYVVDAGAEPHVQKKGYPDLLPIGPFDLLPPVWCMFCPAGTSGAYVSCDDLQKPYVSLFRIIYLPAVASFCQLSASAASRSSFRMVGDTAVFHVVALVASSFLCARHFVLALWLRLQICSGGRELSTRHVAPQLTCGDHRQTPRSTKIPKQLMSVTASDT